MTFTIEAQAVPNSGLKGKDQSSKNDVERDRTDAILCRFHSERALNNAEQIDGIAQYLEWEDSSTAG